MMKFDGLSEEQEAFREKVRHYIELRRTNMALMYGDYVPVVVEPDTLIFKRVYMGEGVQVTITRNAEPIIELITKEK